MYLLNKHMHPANCRFARYTAPRFVIDQEEFELQVDSYDDVYHIQISENRRWDHHRPLPSLSPLKQLCLGESSHGTSLSVSNSGELALKDAQGNTILRSCGGMGFGVADTQWLFTFVRERDTQFYGLGEKQTPFEKSGRAYKFWNLDCWADHGHDTVEQRFYDPDYISIPYLIIKRKNEYVGILIDNAYCSVISIDQKNVISEQMEAQEDTAQPMIYLGAENGSPSVYLLYGPSLAELTRKFQKLVGTVPLPPLWALGYHQSRWGYRSEEDLFMLAQNFEKHGHPVDGLWLDIGYMDEYKVFSFDPKQLPDSQKTAKAVHDRGYHIVPILDPGIKKDENFDIYRRGKAADIFCKNRAGTDFVGLVWPGLSVFPDFSTDEGQKLWATWVREFAAKGFHAAWIDMNDPSTGRIQCTDMLFEKGKKSHETYHNLYGSLMAKATREGFEAAWPDERVFLLSRSGFTGAQRFSAHWTGDNFSNYFHLRHTISKSINLALSGMPFNGPDIGGFGGDATEQLFIDWIKACFLFPFFRNHCAQKRVRQEPWMLGENALQVSVTYTRLRYKLLPYLYNLFIEQQRVGEAILRPLFYDFEDSDNLCLGRIDTQHLIGPAIMQAPFVEEGCFQRDIVLPDTRWYRADRGEWVEGNKTIRTEKSPHTTPLFIRDGSVVPMQRGVRKNNGNDLRAIELLLCLSPDYEGSAGYVYTVDDGISFAIYKGKKTTYKIEATRRANTLLLTVNTDIGRAGEVRFIPVTTHPFDHLIVETDSIETRKERKTYTHSHFGHELVWYRWE